MHEADSSAIRRLVLLARMHGVQRSYWSIFGERKTATPETLLATLRALAVPVDGLGDVEQAIIERRRSFWRQLCEPVHVSWDGRGGQIVLRIPDRLAGRYVRCQLRAEGGDERTWEIAVRDLPVRRISTLDGGSASARLLTLPGDLALGYYELTFAVGDISGQCLLIVPPTRISAPEEGPEWGVFLPLYALRSQHSLGVGDYTDLEELLRWTVSLGGDTVGTLPLLPVFRDAPHHASPYSAASRLFWNELYLDLPAVPELHDCPTAQALLASPDLQRQADELNRSSLVPYADVAALRRPVLAALAESFFSSDASANDRHAEYRRFLEENPQVVQYAAFRATMEAEAGPWPTWPERLKEGPLEPADGHDSVQRLISYGQWLAHEQLARVAATAGGLGASLYLDLPVGVPYDSYDVWCQKDLFAAASTGAPPDTFFIGGQDWGFPPLHPQALRRQGYRYLIDSLRHHLQFARRLRIDHIMGCHRLFFIPPGIEAPEGVYVRYRAEEMFAILCLEAERHGAMIIGEDLGTVPNLVREAMQQHGVRRMYTLQTELTESYDHALPSPSPQALSSLNTHDMPPFAAFLEGADIDDLLNLGHLDEDRAGHERHQRGARVDALIHFLRSHGWLEGDAADAVDLMIASTRWLASSPAASMIVSLEDLWGEMLPQNVPGTTTERPNWQRRARKSLEELKADPGVLAVLEAVNELRKARHEARSGQGDPTGSTSQA
jgi:4-alpha-glucanotransferase